jgi:pimeloyl-ACP methyl ester carboxylesterase
MTLWRNSRQGTRRHFVSILALTISFTWALAAGGAVPPTRSHAISEKMFVLIGGIEQWITIKGQDGNNPVVLYLHGGPGNVMSPFADGFFKSWQRHFTLVMWDQRGAGRTYGRTCS